MDMPVSPLEKLDREAITPAKEWYFINNLHIGTEVVIREKTDDPKKDFGFKTCFMKWTVTRKFPYTAEIMRRTRRGYILRRCVPYGVLMVEQQDFNKKMAERERKLQEA